MQEIAGAFFFLVGILIGQCPVFSIALPRHNIRSRPWSIAGHGIWEVPKVRGSAATDFCCEDANDALKKVGHCKSRLFRLDDVSGNPQVLDRSEVNLEKTTGCKVGFATAHYDDSLVMSPVNNARLPGVYVTDFVASMFQGPVQSPFAQIDRPSTEVAECRRLLAPAFARPSTVGTGFLTQIECKE